MKSKSVTQYSSKANEQYCPVYCSLFCNFPVTFESVDEIPNVTIQIKATEQYFPVVLFIILYKVFLTLILECDHSDKSYSAELWSNIL